MARMKCPRCMHINPSGAHECVQCKTPLPRILVEAPAAHPSAAPEKISQFRQGDVLANRYTFQSIIGRGGMGCIYKVRDDVLGEVVALKTLLPQFGQDKMVLERFFNEARIARRLAHPNIVRVHDIGISQNIVYISMEFLSGQSLREKLEALPAGGRMAIQEVLRVADQLCAALEYAHQYTVHRDIKPENVMIVSNGTVKLMDFGISKLMADQQLTGASIIMGTPMYMAPEQVRSSQSVDARADIYSVGVMLYEIITSIPPTGIPKKLTQVVPEVPVELEAIVEKCVEPNRERRYADATELRSALRAVRHTMNGSGPLVSSAAPAEEKRPFDPMKVLGGMAAVAILWATAWGLQWADRNRRDVVSAWEKESQREATPAAASWDSYAALVKKIQPAAESRAAERPGGAAVLSRALALWQGAESTHSPKKAWEAAQCLAALAIWPQDLCLVPPGEVSINGASVHVPAFFIEHLEVSLGSYREFCKQENWRIRPGQFPDGADPNDAMGNVSFSDAQAYAASRGWMLPTEAQWARAAYGESQPLAEVVEGEVVGELSWVGCEALAGDVSEWTRSPINGEEDTPLPLGTEMVLRGGNAEWAPKDPLTERANAYLDAGDRPVIEWLAPYVGFRCVMELPVQPELLEALVNVTAQP